MSEQISVFSNGGGFVVHKVFISGSACKFSAWYDKDGKLLDAERISWKGFSFKATPKQCAELARLGRNFKERAYRA